MKKLQKYSATQAAIKSKDTKPLAKKIGINLDDDAIHITDNCTEGRLEVSVLIERPTFYVSASEGLDRFTSYSVYKDKSIFQIFRILYKLTELVFQIIVAMVMTTAPFFL